MVMSLHFNSWLNALRIELHEDHYPMLNSVCSAVDAITCTGDTASQHSFWIRINVCHHCSQRWSCSAQGGVCVGAPSQSERDRIAVIWYELHTTYSRADYHFYHVDSNAPFIYGRHGVIICWFWFVQSVRVNSKSFVGTDVAWLDLHDNLL